MKKINILLMQFFLFFALWGETVTISTVEGLPLSDICSFILEKVYEKAGLDLEIIPMPPARGTMESTSGRTDGETHRVAAYGEKHPQLTRLSTSIYSIDVALFTSSDNPALHSTENDLPLYSYAILRGIQNSKDLTSTFSRVETFDDAETMFNLIKLGRIDFAVTSNIYGKSFLSESQWEGIVQHPITLQRTELYHYLNKSNDSIITLVNETLEAMKRSGELDQIIREAEGSILKDE